MIREVNLISHLPLFIQEYREIQGVMNAEDPELQLVEDTSEIIKNNMFVVSTNEVGIKRYENMFGLTPSKNDSLSNRQAKVLTQYTNTVIYTMRGLIERLNVICGVGNYTLELIPNEYKINISLHLQIDNLIDVISSTLTDMIPANMLFTCTIRYNTHKVLTEYPTYLLMQFTHQELYDETIADHISTACDDIAKYTAESLELINCEHILNFGIRKV